jgi:predicted acylesterase/phospholipase RssA
MPERKTALVVSGGGSKGAFAVGAIEVMVKESGLSFDIVAGTSTGALIAPLVVTGEIDDLVRIYCSVRTKDIVVRRRVAAILNTNSILDVGPLIKLINREMTGARVQTILGSSIQMFLTTVSLQTAGITYFQTGPPGKLDGDGSLVQVNDGDTLKRAILASADMPALMPPLRIPRKKTPVRQYVDGGVKACAPFKPAIDNGATDIYAVLLSPAPEHRKPETGRYDRVVRILIRTIDILTQDVADNDVAIATLYNEGVSYLAAVRQKATSEFGLTPSQEDELFSVEPRNPFAGKTVRRLHIVRPRAKLRAETLEFNPDVMKRMMREGRKRAREVLGG